jgi:hypothetical protein
MLGRVNNAVAEELMNTERTSKDAADRAAFKAQLPALLASHRGKYALFKDGALVDVLDTMEAAYRAAVQRFGLATIFIGHIVEPSDSEQLPALMHGLIRAYL